MTDSQPALRGRWVTTPLRENDSRNQVHRTVSLEWIRDLVRVFGLKQQPVPKYVMSVDHMMLEGRESVLSVGRFRDAHEEGLTRGTRFIEAIDASNRLNADYSVQSTILTLLLAFVLGQAIAWIYAWSHSGLSYSRTYTQSLVLMTIVVSLVMMVIGNSIVTAFGLLGALALIRFRNVLKDTRDTVFVFMSLVVGMSVGTQRFQLAHHRYGGPCCWSCSI